MTVWGYGRVSTIEQASDDKSSLDDQIRRCQGVAMAVGLPNPEIVIDPGVSGSIPLADRPNGGKMFAALKDGDTVIAAKLDRLFRSASDALNSVEAMKKNGVRLILTDIGNDPVTESAVAKMFLTILAGVAEFEKYRILERMRDGRAGKRDAHNGTGHIGGRAPYGFDKIGHGKDARLVTNDEEKDTAAIAFELKNKGTPLREISRQLAKMGRFSRSGSVFSPIQITRMCSKFPPNPEAH